MKRRVRSVSDVSFWFAMVSPLFGVVVGFVGVWVVG